MRASAQHTEFVALAQEALSGPQPVTVEHLTVFAETFADLADAEIMKGAWE